MKPEKKLNAQTDLKINPETIAVNQEPIDGLVNHKPDRGTGQFAKNVETTSVTPQIQAKGKGTFKGKRRTSKLL